MKRHKVPHVSLLFGHRGVCIFEEVSIICFRGPVVSYGVDENIVFSITQTDRIHITVIHAVRFGIQLSLI